MTILRAIGVGQVGVRAFEARPLSRTAAESDRTEQLENEVTALKEALAALQSALERKLADSRDAGRSEGQAAAERDFAARSASLAEAARHAAAAIDGRLAELEGLAALIAEAALAQLFGVTTQGSDLVTTAICRQVAALRRETVLGIHVSAVDFPDSTALDAASQACGDHELTVSSDLSSGSCVIKLTLGELDLSLPTQWEKLSRLLHELASEGAAQ
jgi:flagellar assembly protein FliH